MKQNMNTFPLFIYKFSKKIGCILLIKFANLIKYQEYLSTNRCSKSCEGHIAV
jgi:hypothetical protein